MKLAGVYGRSRSEFILQLQFIQIIQRRRFIHHKNYDFMSFCGLNHGLVAIIKNEIVDTVAKQYVHGVIAAFHANLKTFQRMKSFDAADTPVKKK